jgi:hypothetical protein
VTDAREIHQVEYRWHPVKDLFPVASSMSPESTRGWDIRLRTWVRHPPVDTPSQSVSYQILPPNGSVAALAFRSRVAQASARGGGDIGRPHVSRVLVGNTSLLTPEVAIALCRMGLPALAGDRPGHVAAGAELPAVRAAELCGLASEAVGWLDREAGDAADGDGLSQVIAAAIADPNAPLAIGLSDAATSRPPGDGAQARLLWGLWRITRPLLGTVRRGWSFSTFEVPVGVGDPATLPDVVFRADAAIPPVPLAGARREIKAVPGDPGALEGTSQAWLAEWLIAEYLQGGGAAVARLVARCGVEQPLQARLGAVYELLHAKWARAAVPVMPAGPTGPRSGLPLEPGLSPDHGLEPGVVVESERAQELEFTPEFELAADLELVPEPGLEAGGAAGPRVPPRLFGPGMARSVPELLRRLAATEDSAEFTQLLQDILTVGAEPELGCRVDARRALFEASWCTDPSRPAGRTLHSDELARIFQVIVIPDLDRPRTGREIADWAATGPPAVIGALLGAARGESYRSRSGDKYQFMMALLQPALARRWAAENGLQAEWDPGLAAHARREAGRGFLGFRKRG